jgi:hypothetical protein
VGGERGDSEGSWLGLGFEGSARLWKDWMDREMERLRERGREEERSELGLMLWITVLRVGFEDFRLSFVAEDRNSGAEDLREERSRFSMGGSDLREGIGIGTVWFEFSSGVYGCEFRWTAYETGRAM